MGRNGIRYSKSKFDKVENYISEMISDGRVITVSDNGNLNTVLFFSVCYDYEPYYKKGTWEYKPHNSDGTTLYIEKFVSSDYKKSLRHLIGKKFMSRYPQLDLCKFHRWGKVGDRPITIRRRIYA